MDKFCLVHLLDETTVRCLKRGTEDECDREGRVLEKQHPNWNLFLVEEEDLDDIVTNTIKVT